MTHLPRFTVACLTSVVLALGSCTHVTRIAPPTFTELTAGLTVTGFETKNHRSLIISNNVISNDVSMENQPHVNIYLEGDGLAWSNRHTISKDPTPRYALALDLMRRDPGPAFYLTRPCYHALADPNCNDNDLWTSGRYSQEVVAYMVEAVNAVLASTDTRPQVTLIGYSGGGALALLIANQVPEVDTVVTVAGNLDTDAWTAFHAYTPLHQSLNPAKIPLRKDVRYVHFVGTRDGNVPPELGSSVYTQPGHTLKLIEDFDHRCCWVEQWAVFLSEIK